MCDHNNKIRGAAAEEDGEEPTDNVEDDRD